MNSLQEAIARATQRDMEVAREIYGAGMEATSYQDAYQLIVPIIAAHVQAERDMMEKLAEALEEIKASGTNSELEPVVEGGECWVTKKTEAAEIAEAALSAYKERKGE